MFVQVLGWELGMSWHLPLPFSLLFNEVFVVGIEISNEVGMIQSWMKCHWWELEY